MKPGDLVITPDGYYGIIIKWGRFISGMRTTENIVSVALSNGLTVEHQADELKPIALKRSCRCVGEVRHSEATANFAGILDVKFNQL